MLCFERSEATYEDPQMIQFVTPWNKQKPKIGGHVAVTIGDGFYMGEVEDIDPEEDAYGAHTGRWVLSVKLIMPSEASYVG